MDPKKEYNCRKVYAKVCKGYISTWAEKNEMDPAHSHVKASFSFHKITPNTLK